MKTLSIAVAAASLLATAAIAAPAEAQCTCVRHHRVVHRAFRHTVVRHVRTRVIVREVVRPVYVDRPVYPHYRPEPVIDEGRFVPPDLGPLDHPHRWRHRHWREGAPVRYEGGWRGEDDWRPIAIVHRY